MQRADGSIDRLGGGYDDATGTLTLSDVVYADNMPLTEAVKTIRDLFSEFLFADGDRSRSVAVSALVSLYAAQLLPEGTLRPCFIVTKNAEGAGATTLVSCIVVPILGWLPTGVAPGEEPEMRKMLTAAVRESRPVVLFDNQKSHLSSPPWKRSSHPPSGLIAYLAATKHSQASISSLRLSPRMDARFLLTCDGAA